MNEEIEIKLVFKDEAAVKRKLKRLGAKKEKVTLLQDAYYGFKGQSIKNTNRLVRIRQKDKSGELTYKGICEDKQNIWKREEITIGIDDPKEMRNILELMGLSLIKENASIREIWRTMDTGDLEIVFIKFIKPKALQLMEIEGKDETKIRDIISGLGSLVKEAGEDIFASFDS
jgi:predicted adenylyl cyclase CyaB